jgi:argininosuccinate lyase
MFEETLDQKVAPLWSGRFVTALDDLAHRFSSSITQDGKLYREDIAGSIAHARMLGTIGVLSEEEVEQIVNGLSDIREQIDEGTFAFSSEDEDVHMAIESKLIAAIGEAGRKLHTGRSRNDQVTLDERLYLKRVLPSIQQDIRALQQALVSIATAHADVILPGYTHLQRAQPVLLAHYLLAYVEMFERDYERVGQCLARLDMSPLGAAAFAGSPFPLDREAVANELGFSGIVRNSIDAVSDRDYLIEFASAGSIIMMHLSRMAEELIIWSTSEFGFVQMSDAVTTGSSIMPQKKNPDMAELVRGKTGKVYGALVNLLTIMKSLPLAYNRDMQEDKAPMFQVAETVASSLRVMTLVLNETTFNSDRMAKAVEGGYLNATEMADYLVRKGVPFRTAHSITGQLVAFCSTDGSTLQSMDLETLQQFSTAFESDVYECLAPEASIRNKRSEGSTSSPEVERQITHWKKVLS